MSTEQTNSLVSIPANRKLLDELFSQKLISLEAYNHALKIIHPAQNWGLWISKLLSLVGITLILSGIIYFAAFNWDKITPLVKLSSIQILIFSCLAASFICGLGKLSGKLLLLASSILVGVFLAVFGQIYQTGADSYTLFLAWALLILPWVAISEFAGLWIIWIAISNVCLIFYLQQTPGLKWELQNHTAICLIMFNLIFLGVREYFCQKNIEWLSTKWTRAFLVAIILTSCVISACAFLFSSHEKTYVEMILSVLVPISFYVAYRYKLPDLFGLSATILTSCVIFEIFLIRVFRIYDASNPAVFLLMGFVTVCIFTFAIMILKKISNEFGSKHV